MTQWTNEIEIFSNGLLVQQLIRSAVNVWFGKYPVTSTLEEREPVVHLAIMSPAFHLPGYVYKVVCVNMNL